MDFGWHIRGLKNGINLDANGNPNNNLTQGDLFASKLDFETVNSFNGTIGKNTWQFESKTRSFTYAYDRSDKLKNTTFIGLGADNFGLAQISYDKNGNILSALRNGNIGNTFGLVDNLSYFYSGNRLSGVTDAVSGNADVGDFRDNASNADFSYLPNGSLASDLNRGIASFEYNTFLKKISKINYSNGNWLSLVYNGDGTLLKKVSSTGDFTEFADRYILKNNELYQQSIPDGRAVYEAGSWKPEFEYRDIWNNLRLSFAANGSNLVVKQTADYDAFGWSFNETSTSKPSAFKFQNQQRIDDFGLNLDLFKFRASDPQIGRLLAVDPLAESYPYNSPFALQENKFGKGIELEGAELKEFGQWLGNKVDQVLSYTDVDDFTVNVTNFTRGGNAVHIDGQPATGSDKVFAAGGLFLPVVSGGAVKKIFNAITNIKANQAAGTAREVAEHADLVKKNPGASVQNQQYLRTADGKIAKDPVTGTGRRADHVVIKDGIATDVVETTSQTANKNKQLEKEGRIRDSGGTYIRDRNTKELIDIQNTPTEIKRHN